MTTTFREMNEVPSSTPFWLRVSFTFIVGYFTKLLSCLIHELFGHGLWACIFGADRIWFYVSWLGFGWCKWQGLDGSYIARVMVMAGGLIDTSIVGVAALIFLYLTRRRGGFYLRFLLFWLGFWASTTQAAYLILGGLVGTGDPASLSRITGVPLVSFIILGLALFLSAYIIISILFLSEMAPLFPEYSKGTLLFIFWLIIPLQVFLLAASPEHKLTFEQFTLSLALSILPSLVSIIFKQKINSIKP